MSWASHPTNEMPATSANTGRHRRRRSRVIGLSVGAALLVIAVVGAIVSPTLFGWPPSSTPAGQALPAPTIPTPLGSTEQAPVRPSATPLLAVASATTAGPPATTKLTSPQQTGTAVTLSVPGDIEALENAVLALTNVQRVTNKCPALRLDTKLRTAARNHTTDMAFHEELTHTGSDGSDPGARIKKAGYDVGGGWAENVAAGYPTPEAVMTGWMDSKGHRENILNCSLKAIGVGVALAANGQLYWTQDFGGR